MWEASTDRYETMEYRRCGKSGLKLPLVSFGLWHSFGNLTDFSLQQKMLRTAFDQGITHFDLANNYGPPYGEAERSFGKHFLTDWKPYRDELILSTKAGYDMWPGPYGNFGSRKYLMASLDQSLSRMKVDYVDIFYHHRPDPDTPIEETIGALRDIVRSGKALYAGISNYNAEQTRAAMDCAEKMGLHLLIHQGKYNLLCRQPEEKLFPALEEGGTGYIAFSPLYNGILTGKYLNGIPRDSRAAMDPRYLKPDSFTDKVNDQVGKLSRIAQERGESLAQMALAWVLRQKCVCSVLVGASKPEQIVENCKIVKAQAFSREQLEAIDAVTLGKELIS